MEILTQDQYKYIAMVEQAWVMLHTIVIFCICQIYIADIYYSYTVFVNVMGHTWLLILLYNYIFYMHLIILTMIIMVLI